MSAMGQSTSWRVSNSVLLDHGCAIPAVRAYPAGKRRLRRNLGAGPFSFSSFLARAEPAAPSNRVERMLTDGIGPQQYSPAPTEVAPGLQQRNARENR